MSVDISQMARDAKLDPGRQAVVKEQYEECETNPTAAFLLCFFLGSAGAHRFYLQEWRVGFAHLALFLVGAVSLLWGLTQTLPLTTQLASHPAGAALDTLGVLLLLAALIWEIIDLGRIDQQVYQRNLLIAEGIIGANLLAEPEGAATQGADTAAYAAAGAAAGAAGVITANEVADARALAEERGGQSNIAYSPTSPYDVTATVEPASQPTAPEPLAATEATYVEEPQPAATAADVAGMGAAALGAGALGAAALDATHTSSFDEPTQPDLTPIFTQDEAPTPAAEAATASPADTLPATRLGAYGFGDDDLGDVTDASMPAVVAPTADIAFHNSSPAYVRLPDEEPDTATLDEPSQPLYITPDEEPTASYPYAPEPAPYAPEPSYTPPTSYEPPAEAHVPPVPSVFSASPEPPVVTTPSWDQPTATQAAPEQPNTFAEEAGMAGALAAGAMAQARQPEPEPAPEPVASEPTPTPEPAPVQEAAPQPRRIRVKRAAMLDGKVVGEMVVVGEVLPGETPQDAFDRIQAEMAHYSPEQIAQAANLSPEDQVQIRRGGAE